MNSKNILLTAWTLTAFMAFTCSRKANDSGKNQKETKGNSDTLYVNYTYWWPNSGPFIGHCGDEYSLVFLGTVKQVDPPFKDTALFHTPQKGIVEIEEVLKTRALAKEDYSGQTYFSSSCFYSEVKKGDTVIIFCYEYEGNYSIPGERSIMKINGFDDPLVRSIKKYIEAEQNPVAIKEDLDLWKSRGFEAELKQLIECEEYMKQQN